MLIAYIIFLLATAIVVLAIAVSRSRARDTRRDGFVQESLSLPTATIQQAHQFTTTT